MEGPTVEELSSQVPNKYILVNLVAKRSKQITQGVETYVEKEGLKAVDVALMEIAGGNVTYEVHLGEVEEEDKKVLEEIKALDTNDDADIITEEKQ